MSLIRSTQAMTLAVIAACAAAAAAAQQGYESPPILEAASMLAPEVLSGPDHSVDSRVENDGLLNHYTISSRFGSVPALSTAELHERVNEMRVIAQLDKLKGADEFAKNIGKTAGSVVDGAVSLVTKPGATISGAVSGVGKLFQRAGDSVAGDPASKSEDAAMKRLIGFSSIKREYAQAFGVDPYSSNPILQDHLEKIAWAGYLGKVSSSAALMAVGGGAGAAVSVSKSASTLGDIDVSVAPSDMRRQSRERLAAMGVDAALIDAFLANTVYSPTVQTRLVNALHEMQGVKNRAAFIALSVSTDSADVARYRQRQAMLYAGYHRNVAAFVQFDALSSVAAAGRTADGTSVIVAPVDHVVWTQALDRTFAAAGAAAGKREIWVEGEVSARVRSEMQTRGWVVTEQAGSRLLAR